MKKDQIYLKYKRGSGVFRLSREENEVLNRKKKKFKDKKVQRNQINTIIDFKKLLKNKEDLKTLDYIDEKLNALLNKCIQRN